MVRMKIFGLCISGGKEPRRDMKKYIKIMTKMKKRDWVTLSTLVDIVCLR